MANYLITVTSKTKKLNNVCLNTLKSVISAKMEMNLYGNYVKMTLELFHLRLLFINKIANIQKIVKYLLLFKITKQLAIT